MIVALARKLLSRFGAWSPPAKSRTASCCGRLSDQISAKKRKFRFRHPVSGRCRKTIRGGGDPSRYMVIEPFDRMGPLPRSHAAEANDCFMVRPQHGANRIQGCSAKFRAQMAGSPRFVQTGSISGAGGF